MNTSKQVNVMIGLLMIFVVATFLYFLWDSERASKAEEKQLEANVERGASLYALNCRSCHGLTGQGALENSTLPGAPLNLPDNRPTDVGRLAALQQRFNDTIRCGRVGTLMPPWHQAQGGSLNDFQIEQLVLLITSQASETGWMSALEAANHGDELGKFLTAPIGASETVLTLNDAQQLNPDQNLRLDDDLHDAEHEVVKIVRAPISRELRDDLNATSNEVWVKGTPEQGGAEGFSNGDIIQVQDERMRVTADGTGDLLRVVRGVGGTTAAAHPATVPVRQTSNQIVVERGQLGTEARDFPAGAHVLAGPLAPPTGPLTGEAPATAPCGQRGVPSQSSPTAAPNGSPTAPPEGGQTITGTVSSDMGDNYFLFNNQRNPALVVKRGDSITVNLRNVGLQPHNMRTTGEDARFNTNDDKVSNPQLISMGASGTLNFSFNQTGAFEYRCDVHPTDMKGKITVTE